LGIFLSSPFLASAPLLLVSVVNAAEANAAFEGGTDVLDIKNPAEGALGAPRPGVIADICRVYKGKKPISVALGEFPGKPSAAALVAMGAAQFQPDYLKIAFLAEATRAEIITTLQEIRLGVAYVQAEAIPVVAVAYADTLPSASWTLEEFTAFAQEGGAQGCLVDTWEKNGTSLPNFLSRQQSAEFIANCHYRQLFCGLAGSLKPEEIGSLLTLGPDIIGVRSAACGGDRLRGEVTPQRVNVLKALFSQTK
jgi:hypothetical protein